MKDIHSCSYYCNRPECVLAQRNELRDKLAQQAETQPILFGWLVSPHGEWKRNHNIKKVSLPPESLDWKIPLYVLGGNDE
jgi:hypothetical protein